MRNFKGLSHVKQRNTEVAFSSTNVGFPCANVAKSGSFCAYKYKERTHFSFPQRARTRIKKLHFQLQNFNFQGQKLEKAGHFVHTNQTVHQPPSPLSS